MLITLAVVTDRNWVLTSTVSVVSFAIVPQSVAVVMTLKGRASDKFIRRREQRHLFYVIVLGSSLVGAAFTLWVTESVWVQWACYIAVGIVVLASLINLTFKVSMHALIGALAAVVIASCLSWWVLIATTPLAALTAWSRVYLAKHRPSEVIVGSTLGLIAATALFLAAGIPME